MLQKHFVRTDVEPRPRTTHPLPLTPDPTRRASYTELFSFKDEPNLAESPKLKKHAMSVMNTVDVAVKGLADLDKLVPVLQVSLTSF